MSKNKQGRPFDKERIVKALAGADKALTNSYLKNELNLPNERYSKVRDELIDEKIVEKYRCHGGGIQLTNDGKKQVSKYKKINSSVSSEKDLYKPLYNFLEQTIKDDQQSGIVIDTSALCKKGKWQNPDMLQIIIDNYSYLGKKEVVLTSYEVKQWGRWDIHVVFEAASHRRFVHKSIVVLEWSKKVEFSMTDTTYKIDEIVRECQRFGVGLSILRPWYNSFRLHSYIEPKLNTPNESDIETFLEYVFSRKTFAKESFLKIMK